MRRPAIQPIRLVCCRPLTAAITSIPATPVTRRWRMPSTSRSSTPHAIDAEPLRSTAGKWGFHGPSTIPATARVRMDELGGGAAKVGRLFDELYERRFTASAAVE